MSDPQRTPAAWEAVLFGAAAGGMGWGIRGQYGHETGAMIAGLLLATVLVMLLAPNAKAFPAIRAAAWCAIAMGFGGSMTYGQTVGLTHDPDLVGNWSALRWGMLGLSIKGALWIGFAGLFLGMGLSGVRYRTLEMALLLLALLALCWLGIQALNRPFDPEHRLLPRLYFSADWRFRPEAELKPRREVWGGYLFAFAGLLAYCAWIKPDKLARNLGLWAGLGGAIGFPLGQCLQAWHAWNRPGFATGIWAQIDPVMNWWNWMETTFGTVMGAALGLGLWLNRHRVRPAPDALPAPLPYTVEVPLVLLHTLLLALVEFASIGWVDRIYDFGLMLGVLPILLVTAGRLSPFLFLLPIIALPIAGKTVRELVYEQATVSAVSGWILCAIVPLVASTTLALILHRRCRREPPARELLAPILLFATWLYWSLNFGFFRVPWPWQTWTARTPNAVWFTLCALALSWAVWRSNRNRPAPHPSS